MLTEAHPPDSLDTPAASGADVRDREKRRARWPAIPSGSSAATVSWAQLRQVHDGKRQLRFA
ncbi:MAG: hypothetical protein OXB98_16795 [Bryobacterales bacterium]|nr:hypothetical protein [Bryobacterales bacterium]